MIYLKPLRKSRKIKQNLRKEKSKYLVSENHFLCPLILLCHLFLRPLWDMIYYSQFTYDKIKTQET